MKTYYAGGTIGDAYVILCKLYPVAKKEKILCRHYTAYERLRPIIKEIYSLIPNIGVEFRKPKTPIIEICGTFRFPGQESERAEYDLEPEYYPELESADIDRFNLPEAYETLQIKAGSHGDRNLPPETVKRILNSSRSPVVFIGENTTDLSTESFNAMDLRGRTTVKEVASIIKGSRHFYGSLGFLSFLAVSQRIMSDVYIKSQQDISAIKFRIEAVEEWRKFLIRR